MNIGGYLKAILPKGELFERLKRAKSLSRISQGNEELENFSKYLLLTLRQEYLKGRSARRSNGKFIPECFQTTDDMIILKDIRIPIPDAQEMHIFEYEFYDLLLPYIVKSFDKKWDRFYHEGPYELNEDVSVKKDDIVFDCGANMGWFSAIADIEVGNEGKVYAFEPSKYVREHYLSRTAKTNQNILVEPYALSHTSGKMDMYVSDVSIDSSSLIKLKGTEYMQREQVEVVALDDFVNDKNVPKVSFIKADIEGAERDMLRGAKRILAQDAPTLSICTYYLADDAKVLEKIILEANPRYKIEHRFLKLYAYCD